MKKGPYIAKDDLELAVQKYSAFDNLIEGVQVLDYNWRYCYVNDSLARHGLSTREALIGNSMLEKYPGIEKMEVFQSLQSCMTARTSCEIINRFDFPDGTKKWFELSVQPLPEGIIILSSDITKLKKTEAELLKKLNERNELLSQISNQKKQLEEFCQIVAHNLRAPLSNLILLNEVLSENHSLEDKFKYFEMQKPIILALQTTFEELVYATQIKMDATIKKGHIDMDKTIEFVKNQLDEEITKSNAKITFDFTKTKKIHYSKKYINAILYNLVSNSIRYHSPERTPKIHIRSFKKKGWICLEIKDNGLGIDIKKNKNDLFKLHKTFHSHPEAKGFGLFITKIQIEALGGSISAKSLLNHGSTFTVELYKSKDK
ncbi:MAG: PAS domain-containing sensor histidine kinase [Flavobacterium sp.]|nr:PAS domain-containing sensor histidine kinase [Flavobacterium sp.]